MSAHHYYGYVHGEIGKARRERDLAVAQLILDAADKLASYVARVVMHVVRPGQARDDRTHA